VIVKLFVGDEISLSGCKESNPMEFDSFSVHDFCIEEFR